MQWIAQRRRESHARLGVVLQVLQVIRRQIELLPGQDRVLLCLVVADARRVNRETGLQRTLPQIGLRKAKQDAAHQVADARLDLERLAKSQEVVGRVTQPDE